MDEKEQPRSRVMVAVPIRVRGLSSDNKFFDEPGETCLVSRGLLVTRLQNLVDLETELYVINSDNNVGGLFRVLWVNTQAQDERHDVGLEFIQAEGDLWGISFPAEEGESAEPAAETWLACQRCHQRLLTSVPEAAAEFFYEGFRVSRTCDHCRATTPWEFAPAETPEAGPMAAEAAGVGRIRMRRPYIESRRKGRAPIETDIKVIRNREVTILEDICKTVNVSRHGAYFLTKEAYAVGERVSVVLHYKEGDVSIPVPAYVVRVERARDSLHNAVAIRLEAERR
jgi:hypothetical protein